MKPRLRGNCVASRLLLLLALPVGCGTSPHDPATYPATGVVVFNGQPVEGAIVEFAPASESAGGAGAQARTDAAGRFTMSLLVDNGQRSLPGLPAGEYRVTVVKMESPGEASLTRPPKNVLPPRYQSPSASPLSATVSAGGPNDFQFAL